MNLTVIVVLMQVTGSDWLMNLNGGGEVGALMRSKDWSTSPLGLPDTWPETLRNTISLLLASRFPMFLWWGEDTVMFYNDAYLPIAGKKHPQALGGKGHEVWSEVWAEVKPMVKEVFDKKQATLAEDQLLEINRHGYVEAAYFTYSHSPVFLSSGEVGGVFCVVTETTEKVLATERIKNREQHLRHLFTQAPVAICIVRGPDYIFDFANENMLLFLGRTSAIIGKPILEALPEADSQGLIAILENVRLTGKPYSIAAFPATLLINEVRELRYFDLVFKPYYENASAAEISSIFCVAHNVTEQALTRKKLEQSESTLQQRVEERTADLEQQKLLVDSILNASFNGIYALKAVRNSEEEIVDFRYLFANKNITAPLQLSSEEVIGASMLAIIPENKTNGFFQLFCEVLETGRPVHDVTHFVTTGISNWYDYVIVPTDKETVVVTIRDITEQKLASLQIEEQRNLLDNIMKYSPSGITVTEVIRNDSGDVIDGRTIIANAMSEKYVGMPLDQMLDNKISENDPNILTSPIFKKALETLTTGEPFIMQYYFEPTEKWLELSVAKMNEDSLINVFTDVTTIKKAELEIRQTVKRLAAVFNAAQSGMFTFSPVYNDAREIVDFRFVITNANFAAYVGQTPEVLAGALGSTWFPGYIGNGTFEMYKKTFITGETQRQDIHYNVDGHDLYLDLMSTKVGEEVLVTFTDHTPLKTAQFQLEKHIEELKRSNANLEEFAHAASHDLKEPVRKMQVFYSRLKSSFSSLSNEQQNLFDRVEDATHRMSLLIDDLLDYSQISMGIDLLEKVDLNKKLETVIHDLEIAIEEKGAFVEIGELPIVDGHKRQLQQLFHNLIQNALKYSQNNITPHITVTAEIVTGETSSFDLPLEKKNHRYHLIKVQDNGIGFQQEYAERIFRMFQRLHGKAEYSGSGVGLAIVKRVVENHNGYIAAESNPGEGATFKILLPIV
ncbi:PAS domain-containing protein [Segetibacter aerophilus]|uniref:PAS domain-containing protein n=1 Tax=Segetibacter aerophilus TaxID=670293 RepID=UPI00147856A4|nr:PAS domain-containing protein [Segetibacter aerophilus]